MPPSQILLTTASLSLADEQTQAGRIKTALENAGIKPDVSNSITQREHRRQLTRRFRPVLSTLLGLSSMIAAVGGIGLSGTLAISVMRRREIGVLKAIGAPFRAIFTLVVLEGLNGLNL